MACAAFLSVRNSDFAASILSVFSALSSDQARGLHPCRSSAADVRGPLCQPTLTGCKFSSFKYLHAGSTGRPRLPYISKVRRRRNSEDNRRQHGSSPTTPDCGSRPRSPVRPLPWTTKAKKRALHQPERVGNEATGTQTCSLPPQIYVTDPLVPRGDGPFSATPRNQSCTNTEKSKTRCTSGQDPDPNSGQKVKF